MGQQQIKIGIIGAGIIAPAHISAFGEYPDRCKVTAICDIVSDLVKEKSEQFKIAGYNDYKEMIEKESLNAVCIATPPATHKKIALDVISMGCNVICEKPLAMTVSEGQAIADAVAKAGILFMVAFCHRFEQAIVKIKDSVSSGQFGPITTYRNVFANSAGHRPTRGGNLMDNGSHATDIARYILGDPIKVLAAQFRPKKVDDLDKVIDFSALLEGPNEEMIYLEAGGRHAGGRFFVEVCGEKTSALYDYTQGKTIKWNDGEKWNDLELPNGGKRFFAQAKHFLDCLQNGEKCIIDVFESLKTMELLEQIAKSAEANAIDEK